MAGQADKSSKAAFLTRHSVTDGRVTMKDEQIELVGRDVIIVFGPRRSVCMFSHEAFATYDSVVRQALDQHLQHFERLDVYRQLIATRSAASIDAQKRFRIPQPYLARLNLDPNHPEVDVLHMCGDGYEWLEIWPAGGLSDGPDAEDSFDRAYERLIEAMRGQVGASADVVS